MTPLGAGIGAWRAFWFRPADARALALCRILFYAMLLALYGREDFTFVARVAGALPATSWGVRASGDPAATVSRVAVCGGAGDSLLADRFFLLALARDER